MPEPAPQPAIADAGPASTFRERLWPGVGWLVGAACLGLVLGLTLWLVSEYWSLLTGAVAAVVLMVALWATSPVVAVGPGPDGEPWLWAGRARIPVAFLAGPHALDAAALRRELGPGSDARTYGCLRPWVRTAVHVQVVDPQDPTPGWLVGSRRAANLEAVLRAAGAAEIAGDDETTGTERGTAATQG